MPLIKPGLCYAREILAIIARLVVVENSNTYSI